MSGQPKVAVPQEEFIIYIYIYIDQSNQTKLQG